MKGLGFVGDIALKIILKFSQSNMNLKENCKYIFNKAKQDQNMKNFQFLNQSHNSKYTQTQACSVLFQISNTETLEPLDRELRFTEPKKSGFCSPWKQHRHQPTLAAQEKLTKDYLSINKRVDLHKKHIREPSTKTLSQLIEFPIGQEFKIEKYAKRSSYFEKCKTKESNTKYSQTQYTQPSSSLARLTKIESKSVQVLHFKRNDDCLTANNQKSVLILPTCKFTESKPNLNKQHFKMSLIRKRLKKRMRKTSESKGLFYKQNMNTTFENLLKQKLKVGIPHIKQIHSEWKARLNSKNQKILQRIGGLGQHSGKIK